jgi:hypothetical protein
VLCDPKFAQGPGAPLYDLLAPEHVDVKAGERLVRIDKQRVAHGSYQFNPALEVPAVLLPAMNVGDETCIGHRLLRALPPGSAPQESRQGKVSKAGEECGTFPRLLDDVSQFVRSCVTVGNT